MNDFVDKQSDARLRIAEKIVDSLVQTLAALNYPVIVAGDNVTEARVAEPGEIIVVRK